MHVPYFNILFTSNLNTHTAVTQVNPVFIKLVLILSCQVAMLIVITYIEISATDLATVSGKCIIILYSHKLAANQFKPVLSHEMLIWD